MRSYADELARAWIQREVRLPTFLFVSHINTMVQTSAGTARNEWISFMRQCSAEYKRLKASRLSADSEDAGGVCPQSVVHGVFEKHLDAKEGCEAHCEAHDEVHDEGVGGCLEPGSKRQRT